jgi:hypothetical protein
MFDSLMEILGYILIHLELLDDAVIIYKNFFAGSLLYGFAF